MKEKSKFITIDGKVAEETSQETIEGLLVEVWDKNFFKDYLLGHTLTDKAGKFRVDIDTSHRSFNDAKPDIYFVIYKGDTCLKNTSSDAIRNLDKNHTYSLNVNLNKSNEVKKVKNIYLNSNEKTRIEILDSFDQNTKIRLNTFFRTIRNSHTLEDYVGPLLQEKDSQLIMAVRDRPWPSYGIHGQTIIAACLIYRVGTHSMGISPIYALPDETTNIGLVSAVFKEALDYLKAQKVESLKYMVKEGSIVGPVILSKFGFIQNEKEAFLLENGSKYTSFSISPVALSEALKYDKYEFSDLLEYDFDTSFVETNALYHNFFSFPTLDELLERSKFDILRLIDIGSINFYPPGGIYS
ncbi:MAG: hypothetical protein AAGA77_23945 [Bacteroidota bacterium]